MALFNHATREVTAKIVYYGPGLCGKTTNLRWMHDNLAFKTKGKLVSLATQTDQTLFFDFVPDDSAVIRGMRVRMQAYTVPGQVFYEATRRVVLKGCDAVVFVADSQPAMLEANVESLRSLRQNLLANEIDPAIPLVFQYNKRDLPTALPVAELNSRLNPRSLPWFEAVALTGAGVEETLRGITGLLLRWLETYYGGRDTGHGRRGRAARRLPDGPLRSARRRADPGAAPGLPVPGSRLAPGTASERRRPASRPVAVPSRGLAARTGGSRRDRGPGADVASRGHARLAPGPRRVDERESRS
jgi:signal recognition particle receptor subunit beta